MSEDKGKPDSRAVKLIDWELIAIFILGILVVCALTLAIGLG